MKQTLAKRGFVTIATGSLRYYAMALNLLHSYRFHAVDPLPFAILCDSKNELTTEFDDVILFEKAPTFSYLDKLSLFDYLPYEETIFIDADCLAYGDLTIWFDMFETQGDFCCFGYAYTDLATRTGWFSFSGMREYKDRISFIPTFNGGVYFMRNTAACQKVFSIAKEAASHYSDYSFNFFRAAADEPVLALEMTVCGYKPLDADEIVFAPKRSAVDLDIASGRARKKDKGKYVSLVHWSNYRTLKSQYQFEVRSLNCARKRKGSTSISNLLLYKLKLAYSYLWIYDVYALVFRAKRAIKKKWNAIKKSRFFFSLKR